MSDIQPLNIEDQQKYIAYILKINIDEIYYFEENIFTDSVMAILFDTVSSMINEGLSCSIENIVLEAKKKDNRITKDFIESILNKYNDFSNPEHLRKLVKDNYIKNKHSKMILEDILVNLSESGELDVEKISALTQDLVEDIDQLYGRNDDLKTSDKIVKEYKDKLNKRKQGKVDRTSGSKVLDKMLKRPGAEGQIVTIAALSGGLKSIFVKSLENGLINRDIPVLSLNPEMNLEQTMDRMFCMRGGIDVDDILNLTEEDKRLWTRIEREFESLKEKKNYIFSDKESLSIADVKRRIIRAKNIFRNNGVFASRGGDEYIYVIVDLLSMLTEFSGAQISDIQRGMDMLLEMCKELGVHLLGVLQANENKIRERRFNNPDELDYMKIDMSDIKWGSSWRERSRAMFTITRPLEMKKLFFPDQMDEWNLQQDIVNLHLIKQNEGGLGFTQFVFNPNNLRITPFKKNEGE